VSGLAVSGATLAADAKRILDQVGLSIQPGRLTALIGPNGAGKSSLLRLILGLEPSGSAEVTFEGENLLVLSRQQRARIAAFVEQSVTSDTQMDARSVVALGRIPYQTIWSTSVGREDDAIIDDALRLVGMETMAQRKYQTLSGGEQQRLHIARALAQQPKLLLLDEPTNHLDVHAQLSILGLLRRKAQEGMTILVALHDLNLAAGFFDHLVVLKDGRVFADGPPSHVLTPELLRSVYRVEASVITNPSTGRPLIAYSHPIDAEAAQ